MREKIYTISEASRLLEVENHVLRYWEEELELSIPRNELGHRLYREEDIQLLHCIKELKNKGFQLKAVKEVLPDLKEKRLIDVHKLLATQEELENMEELERLEEEERLRELEKIKNLDKSREAGKNRGFEKNRKSETGSDKNREIEAGRKMESERELVTDKKAETGKEKSFLETSEKPHKEEEKNCKVVALRKNQPSHNLVSEEPDRSISIRDNAEKMAEFEAIMGKIIGKALREQAETMGDVIGENLGNRMVREMDDLMEEREEREEARYKKLDETIRSYQKARQEIAVAKDEGTKKKSRFFKKNKRKI